MVLEVEQIEHVEMEICARERLVGVLARRQGETEGYFTVPLGKRDGEPRD